MRKIEFNKQHTCIARKSRNKRIDWVICRNCCNECNLRMVLFNLIPWFTSWSGNRKSIAERYGVFLLILKIVTAISCETCVSHIHRGEKPLETYYPISVVLLQLLIKLFVHGFTAFKLNTFAIRVRLSLFFKSCNWNLKELPSLGFVHALYVSRIHTTFDIPQEFPVPEYT